MRFLGHGADFQQTVTSMQVEHAAVETASAGTEVGIRVDQRVREGTEVYRVSAVTQGWFKRLKARFLKVLEYWENAEPIPWIRVHDLPDYVRFAHKPHIRAGVDCADCHGQVEKMHAAVQVESLSMGWCLSCHQERDVTRDCLACHY